MHARMLFIGLALIAVAATGCASTGGAPSLMSVQATVVAGNAMLDPENAPSVLAEAIKATPEDAVMLTQYAVSAAPHKAADFRAVALRYAPQWAVEVVAAVRDTLKRLPKPPKRLEIPDIDKIQELLAKSG